MFTHVQLYKQPKLCEGQIFALAFTGVKPLLHEKMALQWAFIVAMVMTTAQLVSGNTYSELTYSCNPSGAITVRNPDPSVFLDALARVTSTSQECSVLVTFLRTTFVVYNCPISHNISFILLKTTDRTILTGDSEYHVIRCQQIPATGVHRMVTDESWVTNIFSTSLQPSVTPSIIIGMEIQDIESGVERVRAAFGEVLRWQIEVRPGYISVPQNCTFTAGDDSDSIHLVQDGCSLDEFLLTHFDYESSSSRHILVTELFAFRFAGSTRIVITCHLLGCVDRFPNPTLCDFSCPGQGRRKRSIERDVPELTEPVRDQYLGGHNTDGFVSTVQTSIEIYEPQAFRLTGGSTTVTTAMGIYISALSSLVFKIVMDRLFL